MYGIADGIQVVTRISVEQTLSDQHVDFRFAQLYSHATKASPAPTAVGAHAFGRSGSGHGHGRWHNSHLSIVRRHS